MAVAVAMAVVIRTEGLFEVFTRFEAFSRVIEVV